MTRWHDDHDPRYRHVVAIGDEWWTEHHVKRLERDQAWHEIEDPRTQRVPDGVWKELLGDPGEDG